MNITFSPPSQFARSGLVAVSFFTALTVGCSSTPINDERDAGDSSGGNANSGGNSDTGSSGGSEFSGGATSGGSTASGGSGGADANPGTGGVDGSGGNEPSGTPYVFVGSTSGYVYAFTMNESTGALTPAGSQDVNALDFMTLGPDKNTLFVSANGSVNTYLYDKQVGEFAFAHRASASGQGTHVNVDPTGQFVFVAHYGANALSFFDYSAATGFGSEEKFSPGEKTHQVRIDAAGTGIYVPCLGSNHIAHYKLDAAAGSLKAAAMPTTPASGGPRHMIFHPSASVAYVLSELSSQIHVYNVNAATGGLEARPDDTVLTNDDGDNWSSDIKITPDGKFLYAVNRKPSEIVAFEVKADRSLTRLEAFPLTGTVRSFAMDPKGKFLQIGGDNGRLVPHAINPTTGALSAGTEVSDLGSIHNTEIHYLPD